MAMIQKVAWHTMLNFGIYITKNGHSMGFDVLVIKCGCMKNITVVKTNILTAECRLYESIRSNICRSR
jgi:hypothetical protein